MYAQLHKKLNVTHLYFTDPNRINFLRAHHPIRFGDQINRKTTVQAERENKTVGGLELGPLGTFTLRVVKPWIVNGKRIGFVEIGKEIDELFNQVKRLFQVEMLFLTRKDLLQYET